MSPSLCGSARIGRVLRLPSEGLGTQACLLTRPALSPALSPLLFLCSKAQYLLRWCLGRDAQDAEVWTRGQMFTRRASRLPVRLQTTWVGFGGPSKCSSYLSLCKCGHYSNHAFSKNSLENPASWSHISVLKNFFPPSVHRLVLGN